MIKSGFTLVEAMVILAVVATLAAFVIPRYGALEAGQASRDFASALMRIGSEAQELAISRSQTVHVRYDDERRVIVFESIDPDSGAVTEEQTYPLPESVNLSAFTLDGAFATSSEWTAEFFPDGSGLDAGIEVEDGTYVYHVIIEGRDGTAVKADDRLRETGEQEWEAGQLEQRV